MLSYRQATAADRPAIERLWDDTDWGALTPTLWEQWYESSDRGPSTVWLAIKQDTGAIVGQFAFRPAFVCSRGRILKAHRAVAPIVGKPVRRPGLEAFEENPIFPMYMHAAAELKARGEALIYVLPDPRWAILLRRAPGEILTSFPYWSIAMPLERRFTLASGYVPRFIDAGDPRIDALWARTAQLHDCLVARTSDVIARRFTQGYLLGVEREGELAALALSYRDWTQWQICDILTVDLEKSLRAILMAVANLADERRHLPSADGHTDEVSKAGLLVTPALEPAVRSLGFQREKYEFHLLVHQLDESLAPADIDPAKWYCSQND